LKDAIYSYDSLNRLVKVEYANGISVEYKYDSAGNVINVETLGGQQ
jgi:YD repeat-containing protein